MSRLFLIQGVFYFLTGIWPALHMESFLAVTGGKTDQWLVVTVGWLLAVSGFTFVLESRSSHPSRSLARIAIGQALCLTAVDSYYVARSVIAPIYLADAAVELLLVTLWVTCLIRERG